MASLAEVLAVSPEKTKEVVERSPAKTTHEACVRLEQGANHAGLTLHRVELLAEALGTPMADLSARDSDGAELAPTSDDVKVEAALALIGKWVYPKDLARAFGWRLDRVYAALESLRERRACTGLHVHCSGGRYRLSPARTILTGQEVQTLTRASATRTRISSSEARLLKAAVDHAETGWTGEVTAAQRPGLAHLINLGWIEHRGGRFFPTREVRFSLGIPRERRPKHGAQTKRRRATSRSRAPSSRAKASV